MNLSLKACHNCSGNNKSILLTYVMENQGSQDFNLLLESSMMRRFRKVRLRTQDELSIINIRTEVFDSNGSTLRGKAYTCKIEEHLAVALQNGCRVYIRALHHPNMSFMASRAVETLSIGQCLLTIWWCRCLAWPLHTTGTMK